MKIELNTAFRVDKIPCRENELFDIDWSIDLNTRPNGIAEPPTFNASKIIYTYEVECGGIEAETGYKPTEEVTEDLSDFDITFDFQLIECNAMVIEDAEIDYEQQKITLKNYE